MTERQCSPRPMHRLVTASAVSYLTLLSETGLPRRTHCFGMLVLQVSPDRPPARTREGAHEVESSVAAAQSAAQTKGEVKRLAGQKEKREVRRSN